jgi:hypothetical protein
MVHRRYLKPTVTAEKIGIAPGTLANWRWKQIGPPYYTIGGLIRYDDDEVDKWIAIGRQLTVDPPKLSPPVNSTSEFDAAPVDRRRPAPNDRSTAELSTTSHTGRRQRAPDNRAPVDRPRRAPDERVPRAAS